MAKVNYSFRSLMFVPAHNIKLLKNAINTNADILLPDIEDSVQSIKDKQIARDNIINFVKNGHFKEYPIFPRVNDRESGQLLKDIYQLAIIGIEGFVYPKAKGGQDIVFFDKLLETIEYERGIPVGTFKIIPLIETTASVLNTAEICNASTRVVAVAFGCEDYLADLEGFNDDSASSIFTARSLIAMSARSKGVIPIDTVHIKVHDLEDLEKNILIAKKLGFEGMLVLHPKELDLVHKYYTPSAEEIAESREIISSFEKVKQSGEGIAIVNGKFIGSPLAKKSYKVIKRYEIINKGEN